jgi:hypothetical protein
VAVLAAVATGSKPPVSGHRFRCGEIVTLLAQAALLRERGSSESLDSCSCRSAPRRWAESWAASSACRSAGVSPSSPSTSSSWPNRPPRCISGGACGIGARRLYATLKPWVLRAREPPCRASIPTERTFPRALRGTVSVQRATEFSQVIRTARIRVPPTQTRQWIEPRLPPNSTLARSSKGVPACGGRGEAERKRIEIDESAPPPANAAGTSTAAAVAAASAASRPATIGRG